MTTYVCDLCGFQSEDRAAILSHLRDEHQVNDPATLGSLEQDACLLILRDQDGATAVDLDAWLGAQLTGTPAAAGACICGHAEEDHGPSGACEVDGCLCAAFETYEDEEAR